MGTAYFNTDNDRRFEAEVEGGSGAPPHGGTV